MLAIGLERLALQRIASRTSSVDARLAAPLKPRQIAVRAPRGPVSLRALVLSQNLHSRLTNDFLDACAHGRLSPELVREHNQISYLCKQKAKRLR